MMASRSALSSTPEIVAEGSSAQAAPATINAAAVIPSDAEIAVVAAADVPLVRWAGQQIAALVRDLDPRKVTGAPLAVLRSLEARETVAAGLTELEPSVRRAQP